METMVEQDIVTEFAPALEDNLINDLCEAPKILIEDHLYDNDFICNEITAEEELMPNNIIEKKKSPKIIRDSYDDESDFVCKATVEEIIPKTVGPKKVAMCTSMDTETVRAAYEDVRADNSETQWAVFKFEGPRIVCSAKGAAFDEFRDQFSENERAFGYIRLQTGDELSKRQKFLFVTYVGPSVSVIQRAKMSTDKSIIKNIISNFAVELQLESLAEFDLPFFVESLNKASGANYGTGVREI